MPAIASSVRAIGSAPSLPLSSRPSPSRVTSARSTTVRHVPSAACSPTWNLTEFVPTSMTANRRPPKPASVFRPRGKLTLGTASQAELTAGRLHELRVLRLDGHSPRLADVGAERRSARSCNRRSYSADVACGHGRPSRSLARADELVEELVERVLLTRERRCVRTQPGEHVLDARLPGSGTTPSAPESTAPGRRGSPARAASRRAGRP